MALIKNRQLIAECSEHSEKIYGIKPRHIKFIIERYFHYAILALMHGYDMNGCEKFNIKLGYSLYTDIPVRFRRIFTYSHKIFGYTFFPVCDNYRLRNNGYNYKPCKKILKQIAEFVETDDIYTLMNR